MTAPKTRKKTNSQYLLIVESETDRGFIEQICKKAALETLPKFELPIEEDTRIELGSPKQVKVIPECASEDFKYPYDSKQGVLQLLEDFLPTLEAQDIKKLALVVDADYPEKEGLGFEGTLQQIANKATNFEIAKKSEHGIIFKHKDNEAIEFGVWIMPNNDQNGELEDFIRSCIQIDHEQPEQCLFLHAQKTINNLPQIKFSDTDKAKAEIATWLAWQEKPGHGLYYSLYANLLNEDYPDFKNIIQWLQRVFAQ